MKNIDELLREAFPDELAQLSPIPVDKRSIREKTFAKLGLSGKPSRKSPAQGEDKPQKGPEHAPEEAPAPAVRKKRRGLRALAAVCAAAAACAALAFAGNAVNPVLMESLPGIGAAFRAINGTTPEPGPPQTVETPSPAPTAASPWGDRYFKCSIQKAALVGSDLHLTLQAHTTIDLSAETSQWYYELTLNGEPVQQYQGSSLDTFRTWTKTQEDTCYNDGIVIPLPEEDAARLSGETQGVLSLVFTDLADPTDDSKQYIYDLSFHLESDHTGTGTGSVWTNEEKTFSADTAEAERNGVQLLAFEGRGNTAWMSIGFPHIAGDENGTYLLETALYRPNGDELLHGEYDVTSTDPSEPANGTTISGTYGLWFGDDYLVATAYQYDGKGTNRQVLAEFTIDLKTNTAYPSERYKDPKDNFYWISEEEMSLLNPRAYPYYRATEEQLQARKDPYQVAYLTQSPGFLQGFSYLVLVTDQDYRDLRVFVSTSEEGFSGGICYGVSSDTLNRDLLDELSASWGDVEEQPLFLPFQTYRDSVHDLFFSNWDLYMTTNLQVYNGANLDWDMDKSGLNAQVLWLSGSYYNTNQEKDNAGKVFPSAEYSYEPGQEYTITIEDAHDGSVLHTETVTMGLPENVPLPENTELVRVREKLNPVRPFTPVKKALLR